MDYRVLGATGLKVSRLCFGALTIGPLQANLPLRDGAAVIRAALAAGVNFIDTAELYETYSYIGEALKDFPETVVSAKCYAYTYDGMRQSVEKACRETGRDYIDIFMLHEQPTRLTLKGHAAALEYLADAKKAGIVRAAGVSTHTIEVVQAASAMPEIDVIHPILNMRGIGIADGTTEDMLAAIAAAKQAGKGIYTMKALGGGHLIAEAAAALNWALGQPSIDAVAVGMQTVAEVSYNCAIFSGQAPDNEMTATISRQPRRLMVEDWCTGCGSCAAKCPARAISAETGKAVVKPERCILCGYCGAYCPEFCLKIV